MEFDLIISTTDASQKDFPENDYLSYPPPPPRGRDIANTQHVEHQRDI